MQNKVSAWRVLIKGALLFIIFEYLFISLHIDPGSLNVYSSLGLLRQRFPTSTYAPEDGAMDVGNLDAMFASHIISRPKAADEFRVVMLGDSALWGIGDTPEQTMPGQMDQLGLNCGNKKIRVYNLGYPRSSSTKDLMILDKAMQYKPDMIVWLITLYTLEPKTRVDHWLLGQNKDEYYRLATRFDFMPKNSPSYTLLDQFLNEQRALFRSIRYQTFSIVQLATRTDQMQGDYEVVPRVLTRNLTFEGLNPPSIKASQLSLDQIQDFYTLAGNTPVLLVNEPTMVLTGIPNSDVRYNDYYPRWVYDQYRQYLSEAAAQHGWNYLDYWNMFPADDFTNTPLHLNPASNGVLAKTLAPYIQKACP